MTGIGIRCPTEVATALRNAGWRGRNGWWTQAGAKVRWWDALPAAMRRPEPVRCPRTIDMWGDHGHL